MTFVRRTADALELTSTVAPGEGPPMHVHRLQEESVTVREGRLAYTVKGDQEQLRPARAKP